MHGSSILKVAEHKGSPRVWIEGINAQKSGFLPATPYRTEKRRDSVILRVINLDAVEQSLSDTKPLHVSKKKQRGRELPVLDLNSHKILSPVAGAEVVKVVFHDGYIVISRIASQQRAIERLKRLKEKLVNKQALAMGGVAAGAGILSDVAHKGLAAAGIETTLRMHNEVRQDLTEIAAQNNPSVSHETLLLNMPLQELAFDDEILKEVGALEIMELGLPCSGASKSGTSRLKLDMAEQHPHVGHLVVGAIALIAKLNPVCCVFENVPEYQTTASAELLRKQLKDLGYDTHEDILSARDFGGAENRRRWTLVAMTKGIAFDLATLPRTGLAKEPISVHFDPPELVNSRWSKMEGLKNKQNIDIAAGKGFRMQIYSGRERTINTLTKGIAKNRSTDPKIQHAECPELLRVPTAREHARIKGIDERIIDNVAETTAHELLGQSLVTHPFLALFEHIGNAIMAWDGVIFNQAGQFQLKFAA